MTILETIKQYKLKEIEQTQTQKPISKLEKEPYFLRQTHSLKQRLQDETQSGIISEFKRASPSKGLIHKNADVKQITTSYKKAKVSGLSVLTDSHFFQAQKNDFATARKYNSIPILRKDFIVNSYQVFETKAMGADVMLLIASILSAKEIEHLAKLAQKLGLEVLLEVHTKPEIEEKLCDEIDLIGINNRNLHTFEVDIENSIRLAQSLPQNLPKIAESGINDIATLLRLKDNGFQGFLIGERFMKQQQPAVACRQFVDALLKK
ncbi:MAG: indole-3-glycerol phosphate synthase TrpC [Chitinophagales bacterium]